MSKSGTRGDPKQGVKSVDTMFSILNCIQERDGAGVTEIADHLGRSKSSVHSHLATLKRNRCVRKEGSTYHIGLRFLNFGGYARKRSELFEFAKPELDELAEETGDTANLVVEEHGRGTYIYQVRGDSAVQTDSHTGTEVYLHRTACGKAILAYLPDERVEEIVERHGLPSRTDYTIGDERELFDRLETVRERGYALDDGERIEGIRCVGVPVTTEKGDLIGSISLSGPLRRMEGDRFREEIPELLCRTARVIEIKATYT